VITTEDDLTDVTANAPSRQPKPLGGADEEAGGLGEEAVHVDEVEGSNSEGSVAGEASC
jgi:hypothetical protein